VIDDCRAIAGQLNHQLKGPRLPLGMALSARLSSSKCLPLPFRQVVPTSCLVLLRPGTFATRSISTRLHPTSTLRAPQPSKRSYSTPTPAPSPATPAPKISVSTSQDGVSTISMNAKPVNAMTADFMKELTAAFAGLNCPTNSPGDQKMPVTRAVVLTSGLGPKGGQCRGILDASQN